MANRFPTEAVLLAAGLGTRMRRLTDTMPKPLITVAGQSLLERVISNARAEGVSQFVVNAHHHLAQMKAAIAAMPARFPGAHFALSQEEDERLETGGGVRKASRQISRDPFFVFNTDAFWQGSDRPLRRMADKYHAAGGGAVLLCAHPARALGFRRSHDFCLNPNGDITLDTGLPVIYAGVALLGKNALAGTPEGPFSLNRVFETMLEQQLLFGILLDASWYHVGDPEALDAVQARLREAD